MLPKMFHTSLFHDKHITNNIKKCKYLMILQNYKNCVNCLKNTYTRGNLVVSTKISLLSRDCYTRRN